MSSPTPDTMPVRELSNPSTQGPAKHHKPMDAGVFHPELSTTSRGQLMDWIRAPITGKLEEVPGLGHKNIEHLGIITDAEREMGEGEAVDSTFQLLGKYLQLRSLSVGNTENAQRFYMWLRMKGVTSHLNSIVEAVAEKVNIMIPGSYSAEEFGEKK